LRIARTITTPIPWAVSARIAPPPSFGSPGTVEGDVRFSNRPARVKRFQTIHDCGVDVAHGFVLLSGLGTKALPSWDSKMRWNNLYRDLAAVGRSKRTYELTSSIVP
jgi:hypothetical protein